MTYTVTQQAERERLESELEATKQAQIDQWTRYNAARDRYHAAPFKSKEESQAFADMGAALAEMEK